MVALVGIEPTNDAVKEHCLNRLATGQYSFIQYMICYPRSSRKDSRSYTDSRRLSIRSTNGKDYTHCTCDNVLKKGYY